MPTITITCTVNHDLKLVLKKYIVDKNQNDNQIDFDVSLYSQKTASINNGLIGNVEKISMEKLEELSSFLRRGIELTE